MIWDLIVSVADHCLPFYFERFECRHSVRFRPSFRRHDFIAHVLYLNVAEIVTNCSIVPKSTSMLKARVFPNYKNMIRLI